MRRVFLWFLQFGITAGLLWWVFHDEQKQGALRDAVQQADWRWLVGGIVAYGVFELLAGVRWQILLRVQGIRLSWRRMYGLLMVGLFFSLFIPGGTGGDLVKGYYLLKEAPVGRKTSAALSVVMDRLLGLLGIALITGSVTFLRWDWLTNDPTSKKFVLMGLGVLGVSVSGIVLAWVISAARLVHRLPERMPGRNFLATATGAYALYGRAWLATIAAIFISVLAHSAHYTTFWCASQSIEHSGPRKPTALELYSALPVIETVAALPITPGGLGTREAAFDHMLTTLAELEGGVAPSISMLGYVCIVFWGIVGGIFYLFYRPSKSERAAIMAEANAQLGRRPSR
jgi:glycosyltransferase 2 family protein